jgi:hypothetical protein
VLLLLLLVLAFPQICYAHRNAMPPPELTA